jgi:teichuronic acid exporter
MLDRTSEQQDAETVDRSLVLGIAWTAAMRWSSQFVSWVATFYAVRLLLPADYGLIAMAMLAIGLARMAQEFGLDAILVQDRSIVGDDQARLAGLLLLFGIGLFAIYALLAQPIAWFFEQPNLPGVVAALALVFIADALQVVPRAQLQRQLDFRRLGLANFVQVLVTQTALVACATAGLGYTSLVVNTLAGELAATLLLVWWSPFALRWPRGLRSLIGPLLQGWRVLASRVTYYASTNADQAIIGKLLGTEMLGLYSFATTLSTLTQQEIGSVVTKVVPSIFSEVQQRIDELRRYFLLLTELLALVSFPVVIGLACLADLFVALLFGPKWMGMVAPLQLLCIYSLVLTSQLIVVHVLMWTGQFRATMWCSVLSGVTMPIVLLFAVRHGLEGIAWAWVLAYPVVNLPQFFFAFRTLRIQTRHWLGALWPALAGCLVMSGAIVLGRSLWSEETMAPALRFALLVLGGAAAYLSVLALAFRPRLLRFWALVQTLRQGTKTAHASQSTPQTKLLGAEPARDEPS